MANDIYSKGSIINDEQFAPFNRYIDVNGLRMFVLDKVKDEFVLDVANTFEAMFPQSSDTIDLTSQQLLLQTMKDFNTFQRIGYIGPPENGEPASAPLSGGWEFAQDYIWEKPSSSTASQIGEVVEHLLHTITSISLKYTFPEKWDWDDPSSEVYLAMQEAIDKGIYNVSSYSSLKSDPEGYNTIIVQEFVYWFVSAEWNYFEVMGLSVNGSWEGGSNEEWSLLTAQEVEEQLPLAHKLYVESFSKLVQKPDGTKVTEWFSTDSSVAESTEDDTTSNTITLDESVYLREGTFLGNNYTIKMLGDNEEEIYAKGTGNAFVVGRDVFSEEQVKEIVALREDLMKQVDKHQEGIEMLEKNIVVLDGFLKDSSFVKASKLDTKIEPKEEIKISKPVENSIPIKRGNDGKIIANAYVTPEQVSIILDEQILINADTPPFKSFFLDRIIGEMKKKDFLEAENGKIQKESIIDYIINKNGSDIREIIIKNYREKQRVTELINTAGWSLTRMLENISK